MSVHLNKPCLSLFTFFIAILNAQADSHFIAKEVEFETEDGWTISGILRLPPGAGRKNEFAAMFMLHEEGHDRLNTGDNNEELAHRLPFQEGIATLAIDWRGREKSIGKQQPVPDELHEFSTKLEENCYLERRLSLPPEKEYEEIHLM